MLVIPAQAGIQVFAATGSKARRKRWIPACAGMTVDELPVGATPLFRVPSPESRYNSTPTFPPGARKWILASPKSS
ncbi:hypothetical protein [Luteimonas sp. R10]|uniref:hypothetical protein n=1 Tax=Luteimonas sp. R10 TaxID=3108176 RepID=UPI0030878A85|nr:hypothetical protein U3649_12800 [Luteimonas sp. R10]